MKDKRKSNRRRNLLIRSAAALLVLPLSIFSLDRDSSQRAQAYQNRIVTYGGGNKFLDTILDFYEAGSSRVRSFPGDLDADGDVDRLDYGRFVDCVSGPRRSIDEYCGSADINGDGHVDLRDYRIFQEEIVGDPLDLYALRD